jgi:hypothetical protein
MKEEKNALIKKQSKTDYDNRFGTFDGFCYANDNANPSSRRTRWNKR